jgi:hypothetical protein
MSKTDELQGQFERALSSLPTSLLPPVSNLHARLRRRRVTSRIVGLAALALVAGIGLGVGLTGGSTVPAGAVVLHVGPGVSERELRADATIMRNRLAILGDRRAHVSISGNSLVVSGGPAQLSDPTSALIASPSLLVRPVLCLSGPYRAVSPSSAVNLPSTCAGTPYAIAPTIPNSTGYSENSPVHDPALAGYPSTAPALDAQNPDGVALLPVAGTTELRYLVGPTALTLSSKVASAQVVQEHGNWIVRIQLDPQAAAQWDQIARTYFHLQIAVDLNGSVVTAPLIEPDQTSYSSFNSQIELSGSQSKVSAEVMAAALESGPLPIPLELR